MKKYLERVFIWVMIFACVFQVALPTVYAANKSFNVDGKTNESGWYQMVCKGGKQSEYNVLYYTAEKKGEEGGGTEDIYVNGELREEKDKNGNVKKYYIEVFLASSKVYYYDDSKYGKPTRDEGGDVSGLERMASDLVYGLANALHLLATWALGETLTIDDLVFNKYAETNIAYFTSEEISEDQKSSLIFGYAGKNGTTRGLHDVVNEWYAIFMKIAFMGYMVILVYMGIRIIFSATAEEKANYKELFMHWVVGVAILVLFPYVMKYVILLNNALVKTIEANKGYSSKPSGAVMTSKNADVYALAPEDAINWGDGEDYMSNIAREVIGTHRLGLAVAFLIMTWQLIALMVAYFKRLFMVGFLIVIFPLVALSYAVDKVADGKSQAFNTWFKEYLLTVFVQSFHAIIYVFMCSTIYSAALQRNNQYDFILVIVGATFLFSGEQIIRQIFGQVSQAGTMKGLGETAAATYLKMSMAVGAIKKTKDVTIGEKSIPRKLWNYGKGQRALNAQIRAIDSGASDLDNGAVEGVESHPGDRIPGSPTPPSGKQQTLKSQKDYERERKYYDAAAVLNNPTSHSFAEKADALKTLKELAEENPDHDIFKNNKTKLTANQVKAMSELDVDVQKMVMDGKEDFEIEKYLTMRLGFILQNTDPVYKKQVMDTYMSGLRLDGATSMVSFKQVVNEVTDTMDEVQAVQRSFSYVQNVNDINPAQVQKMMQIKSELYNEYFREDMTNVQREQLDEISTAIAMLNTRTEGITHVSALQAVDTLKTANNSGSRYLQDMIREKLDGDVDVMTHVVARQVASTSATRLREELNVENDVEAAKIATDAHRWAESTITEYESNPLEGYFADEVSVHEVIAAMTVEGVEEIRDSIEFYSLDSNLSQEELDQRNIDHLEETTELMQEYKGYADQETLEEFSSSLAILEGMDSGLYNEQEVFEASQVVKRHARESKDLADIVEIELGHDAQTIATAVAEKIMGVDVLKGTTDDSERFYQEQMKRSTLDDATKVNLLKNVQQEINTTKLAQIYDGTGAVCNRLYDARTAVMREATSHVAEHYVVENKLDMYAGHVDNAPTVNGYTREELEVMKQNETLKFFSSLVPFRGEIDNNAGANAWLTNRALKEYLLQQEEERNGVLSSWEDMRKVRRPFTGVMDVVEERRRLRQINRDAHFYGDIKNWEEERNKKNKNK